VTLLRVIVSNIVKDSSVPAGLRPAACDVSRRHNGIKRGAPWKLCLLALVPWLPSAAIAAAANASGATNAPDRDLNEVVVTGKRINAKRIRSPTGLAAWLNRLRGDFTYEGSVELGSEDAIPRERTVSGASKCGAYGPSVICIVQVTWEEMHGSDGEDVPGGVSTLAPAMVTYAVDMNYLGIQFLHVGSNGMADSGMGYLAGDTLTTTTACVDLPGDCKRISRIEAQPDGKVIRRQTDIEQDEKRLVRYTFVLRRKDPAKR
jgi:hypothetical protein